MLIKEIITKHINKETDLSCRSGQKLKENVSSNFQKEIMVNTAESNRDEEKWSNLIGFRAIYRTLTDKEFSIKPHSNHWKKGLNLERIRLFSSTSGWINRDYFRDKQTGQGNGEKIMAKSQ